MEHTQNCMERLLDELTEIADALRLKSCHGGFDDLYALAEAIEEVKAELVEMDLEDEENEW